MNNNTDIPCVDSVAILVSDQPIVEPVVEPINISFLQFLLKIAIFCCLVGFVFAALIYFKLCTF